MSKLLLLDLFCGAGGAAMGYHRAGFDVVGVDIKAQPHYPFEFIQADAMTFPLDGFDVIHASPPCQRFSIVSRSWNGKVRDHPDLITPLRRRLLGRPEQPGPCWDGKTLYVIENVVGATAWLVNPVMLCGSTFGLRVRRHRMFESPLVALCLGMPCEHFWQDASPIFERYQHGKHYHSGIVSVHGSPSGKGGEHWEKAMGIDWMTKAELVEAIPPAYTEYIGRQLMNILSAEKDTH